MFLYQLASDAKEMSFHIHLLVTKLLVYILESGLRVNFNFPHKS